jgi:hypothetical protein
MSFGYKSNSLSREEKEEKIQEEQVTFNDYNLLVLKLFLCLIRPSLLFHSHSVCI